MKPRLILALAAAVLGLGGWLLFADREEPAQGGAPWGGGGRGGIAAPPTTVRVAAVEQGEFAVRAEYVGSLRAKAVAELYAETSGQIVTMNAEIGEPVRQGQVLAVIDPVAEREKVSRERAAVRMADATLAQRRAGLAVAQTTDSRVAALYGQQLVSEQDREAAEAALLSAEAEVEVAAAAAAVARANLSAAETELAKTRIVAPFDGFVGQRFLDRGAFAAANRPVLSVVDLSTIRTTVALVQKDATRIAPGQPAAVRTEAFPGREFGGRVARISSVFDPQTNTVEAEIEVDNPERALKPGMFATVAIAYRTEPTALLVPREALLEDDRQTALYVLAPPRGGEGPPTARRAPVLRLGVSVQDDGRVAVEGDLAAGDRVVTLGQELLRDGAPVRVAGEGSEAGAPSAGAPGRRAEGRGR